MGKIIKVLVIDDEEIFLDCVETIGELFSDDLLITTAHDGKDGLEKYNQAKESGNPFDAIITDITMPNMNGLELINTIRAHDTEIYIGVVSANAEYVFSDRILDGANKVFLKPAVFTDIFQKVIDFFNEKR